MAIMAAKHRQALRQIEDCEYDSLKELAPPPPMLETLKEYIDANNLESIDGRELLELIGGAKSQYYHALYAVTE